MIRVAIATSRNVCGRLALNPIALDAIMCFQLQLMWPDSSDFFLRQTTIRNSPWNLLSSRYLKDQSILVGDVHGEIDALL